MRVSEPIREALAGGFAGGLATLALIGGAFGIVHMVTPAWPPATRVDMPAVFIEADADGVIDLDQVEPAADGAEVLASFPVSSVTATTISSSSPTSSWQCNNATATSVFRVNAGVAVTTDGIGPYCTTCALGQMFSLPTQKVFLLAASGTPSVQCSRVGGGAQFSAAPGMTPGFADTRYLKLAADNDPLTGQLDISPSSAALALNIRTLNSSGGVNDRWVSVGNVGNEEFGIYASAATGGSRTAMQRVTSKTSGTAAAPSYTWETDTSLDTGIFRSAENTIGVSTNGTQRITIDTANITTTMPFLQANGTTTNPSYSFSGDPDTGQIGIGAGFEETVSNGNVTSVWGPSTVTFTLHVTPTSDNTQDLGDATHAWRNFYVRGSNGITPVGTSTLVVNGDVSNIAQNPGAVNTDLLLVSGNDAAGIAAKISSNSDGAGSDNAPLKVGLQATTPTAETPFVSFRNNIGAGGTGAGTENGAIRWTNSGARFYGGFATIGTLDFNDTTANPFRGTAPQALPACASSTAGRIVYKEDTDTSGTNSQLCLCARNNGALTYAWVAIGNTLTGTCT